VQTSLDKNRQEKSLQEQEIQSDLLKFGSFCDPNNQKNLFLSYCLSNYPENIQLSQRTEYLQWYFDQLKPFFS